MVKNLENAGAAAPPIAALRLPCPGTKTFASVFGSRCHSERAPRTKFVCGATRNPSSIFSLGARNSGPRFLGGRSFKLRQIESRETRDPSRRLFREQLPLLMLFAVVSSERSDEESLFYSLHLCCAHSTVRVKRNALQMPENNQSRYTRLVTLQRGYRSSFFFRWTVPIRRLFRSTRKRIQARLRDRGSSLWFFFNNCRTSFPAAGNW
jgi:hypothetical protein